MYKVMVVDDEPIVRIALKSLANWENHGFDISFEASNGKQALEILKENPDINIVITDINMPIMDGLKLISYIKEMGNDYGIIVLSAYDEYNLVRQAFKLGALDYILKADMDPENILKILTGITSEGKHIGIRKNKTDSSSDIKLLKESLLTGLIEQDGISDSEITSIDLNLRFEEGNIVLCCMLIDDYVTVSKRYEGNGLKLLTSSVYNSIYQVLDEMKIGEALIMSSREYVIFFSFENINLYQTKEKIMEILGRIKYSLRNYININVTIGISSVKSGFSNIKELYKEAESNAGLRFVLGKGRIIFPDSIGHLAKKDIKTILGKENGLLSALREINKEKVMEELGKLLENIRNTNIGNLDNVYACYMEVVFIFINFIQERNEDINGILGENINFYNTITRFETQEEINIWIKKITETVLTYLSDKKDIRVNRAVIRAQEFVRDNYYKDITLKTASEYVGLSESHLSYIFTKETGETFTDYITRIRIERARMLLETTNMKVYEVSVSVGYANAEHFSRVFKKITGRSPNNYKNI